MASTMDDALAVLLDPALEPIVELVLLRDDDAFEARPVDGDGPWRTSWPTSTRTAPSTPTRSPRRGVPARRANPNVLYDAPARGEAPNVARLMAMGTTFEHGVVSSLPTVTLANHTTAMTGCHPGHHGILHNAWWDRERGEQVVTNSAENWASAMKFLTPGTETIHATRRTGSSTSTPGDEPPGRHGRAQTVGSHGRRHHHVVGRR